jgi:hypothetical protein
MASARYCACPGKRSPDRRTSARAALAENSDRLAAAAERLSVTRYLLANGRGQREHLHAAWTRTFSALVTPADAATATMAGGRVVGRAVVASPPPTARPRAR